jgi:hypothetical protein
VLQAVWASLGVVILVAGVLAGRHPRALQVGCWAVAALFLAAGALVNAVFLARGDDYAGFADGSASAFVRDTWASLVVPHHHLFIGLLVVFEAAVGVLVLLGGRLREVGLGAAVAFHVALVSFGWGFLLWSGPMVLALLLLLRAEHRAHTVLPTGPSGTISPAPQA